MSSIGLLSKFRSLNRFVFSSDARDGPREFGIHLEGI